MRTTTRSRVTALIATAAAAALMLSGCATGDDSAMPDVASDGTFPVTIESAIGDAVIPSEPKRVVTLGWGTGDTVVALGVTPVGMENVTWGGDDDGYYPWVRDAIEESGDELPATFDVYPEIDVDAILQLEPDLILAPQSGLTADDHATLSAIAPTVGYPDAAWGTPWRQQIEIIGEALGKSDQAAGLISDLEGTLADAAAEHPEFDGVTFSYIYAAQAGALSFYQKGDPRVDVLTALGLVVDPVTAALPLTDGTFTTDVGLERADLLDGSDVVFTWFNDEANQKEMEAQPLFAQIPAVKRGSYVPSVDNQLGMASTVITPLSVPWALDKLVPQIVDAVSKVG
ncbi:iron complex transport system substrate-binding protein [Homoserinimonas aerilata]|uniref:Iron complex transport system substrate-binding protein n=1 Tax=Homoserinimonas aerilata TaxID=1162970 RepID=A0A542YKT9_9MICO|nr:iron-siderophore ABC transporter substrate-binding protein [Homoserinimonas aerilata]TQL48720.1 iron complex transport system substrate-binding protein [Homoserinimonas aerilata]